MLRKGLWSQEEDEKVEEAMVEMVVDINKKKKKKKKEIKKTKKEEKNLFLGSSRAYIGWNSLYVPTQQKVSNWNKVRVMHVLIRNTPKFRCLNEKSCQL